MRSKIFCLTVLLATILAPIAVKAGEGIYVGAFGGANWLFQNKHHWGDKLKYKVGYGVGGMVGYRFCNDIRVEAEFTYRRNELKNNFDHRRRHHGFDVGSSDHHRRHKHENHHQRRTYSLMLNGIYDINLCTCFTPYVGGGIGVDWTKLPLSDCGRRFHSGDFEGSSRHHKRHRNNSHKTRFALQAIVGASYNIWCNTDVFVDYRYHWATSHLQNHLVSLGFRYFF